MRLGAVILGAGLTLAMPVRADWFGSGANQFNIDFVTVGNLGNGADDTGYGGVPYAFGISTTEISQDMITKATASGMSNVEAWAWGATQPAAYMSWYEAAAFTNWLNTSTGHQAAYNLTWTGSAWTMALWSSGEAWQLGGENLYRHAGAYYFLPSEDEWYKAAYHQNDGVTANYWDYPTGSNTVPDGIDSAGDTAFDAVFNQGYTQGAPNAVNNVGLLSAYGTMGQGGNVFEWTESAYDGVNNSSSEARGIRGGHWDYAEFFLSSSARFNIAPSDESYAFGFRVAGFAPIPETSSIVMGLLLCGGAWILMRRGKTAG